mgnify:CR=1 FL=1
MAKNEEKLPATHPGRRYQLAVQGAVDAILMPMGITRRVVCRGTRFFNVDAWPWLAFCEHLCEQLSKAPKRGINEPQLHKLIKKANSVRCAKPYIQVAAIPEQVTTRVALAIIGGGYHEAWHTKYSKRGRVRAKEVTCLLRILDAVIEEGGEWDAKLRGLLLTLQHLVEDIRIERCGNQEFPGALQPMRDLQDFILDQEKKSRENSSKALNSTASSNARSILFCCMRDLGLGYNTEKAREAIEFYKETSPEAVALCSSGGPLAPLIQEAKTLAPEDEMGSLRVAAEMTLLLWRLSQKKVPDSTEMVCKDCDAGASSLVVRSMKDEEGRKIRGLAEVECKECGSKWVINLPDRSLDFNQTQKDGNEPKERPEIEDLTWNDIEGSDGFGVSDREVLRDYIQQGKDQEEEEEKHKKAPPISLTHTPTETAEQTLPEGEDQRILSLVLLKGDEDWEMSGDSFNALGLGGGIHDLGRDPKSFFDVAEEVMEGHEEKDSRIELGEALQNLMAEILREQLTNLEKGEALWNPYDPSLDEARVVRAGSLELDKSRANEMLSEVRSEVAFLRARLRSIVRAQEMTTIIHGVPKGRDLSERNLVDTVCDLKSGVTPRRAYQRKTTREDTSIAMAIVLDQSSSMHGQIRQAAQCAMALSDAVESIKGKSMAIGFRDGEYRESFASNDNAHFHRLDGVRYDIYKMWDEKLASSKWRFSRASASGGTPMSDGVQFGLSVLSERQEGHRVLVVLTDGAPNPGHTPVIRRQLRLAKEAGIHVLGVGFGHDARYVKQLFPDHIHVGNIHELPPPLLRKLNDLCDFRGVKKRGRRARLDGKITKRIT